MKLDPFILVVVVFGVLLVVYQILRRFHGRGESYRCPIDGTRWISNVGARQHFPESCHQCVKCGAIYCSECYLEKCWDKDGCVRCKKREFRIVRYLRRA
jgi:hypothetical protein